MKDELTKIPMLAYWPKAGHVIQVDESMKGLGAVLLQKNTLLYMHPEHGHQQIQGPPTQRVLLSVVFGLGRFERPHHYVLAAKSWYRLTTSH